MPLIWTISTIGDSCKSKDSIRLNAIGCCLKKMTFRFTINTNPFRSQVSDMKDWPLYYLIPWPEAQMYQNLDGADEYTVPTDDGGIFADKDWIHDMDILYYGL